MLHDFEAELESLTESVSQDEQELDRISWETVNAEKFLALVKKYTDFSELTPAMINEFVEKILVHQAEGKGASRTQEVEIFFNFVGKVEIPHEEIVLTEEEKAALAEQERRRAKKAEYNRRYMEKKRRQWREQREREQEQKPHELPPVADKKGEKSEPRWADTDRKPSLFPGEGRGYAERREQSDLLLLRSGSSEIYQ